MADGQHGGHTDLLTGEEAARYLRLDCVSTDLAAARSRLGQFVRAGKIVPVRWCREQLFSRSGLDRFVAQELAALRESDQGTDGNGPSEPLKAPIQGEGTHEGTLKEDEDGLRRAS